MIKNSTVVIIGGAGFVGSHLAEILAANELNNEVIVLDNFSRGRHRVDDVTYVTGDAGNVSVCANAIGGSNYIFNLAAHVAGVVYNSSNHLEMYHENIRLLTAPLRAARVVAKNARIIQTSSVCVYPTEAYATGSSVDESWGLIGEPQEANAGYAEAKRDGERAALWSGLDVCIVRPSNVAGPRDYYDDRAHVIPAVIKKIVNSEDSWIEAYGNGSVVREFIHPVDLALGMIAVAERGVRGQAYNVGSGNVICLENLIDIISDCVGKSIGVDWKYGATGDVYRKSNLKKIHSLGWEATRNIHAIVGDAYKYYIENK